jgi:hypothetical protein
MKIKLSDIKDFISLIYNVPTYLDWHRKWMRIQADFAKFLAEWNRIGGFRAPTKQLLDLLGNYAVCIVEYATWTPLQFDEQIAKMIHYVVTNYRDALKIIIDRIRNGKEPTVLELEAIAVDTRMSDGEYGSPMTTLYVLTLIYHVLLYLRSLQTGIPIAPDNIIPRPHIDPPLPVKRPVINFIQTIFRNR